MTTRAAEIARARDLIGAQVRERDLQLEVTRLAELLGWSTYHTLDSRGSAAGFPDLVAVRGSRLIFAELKRQDGRVSPAQQRWLDDLAGVTTLDTYLWRPSDWPSIEETLRRAA